jgi:hypothetical protein
MGSIQKAYTIMVVWKWDKDTPEIRTYNEKSHNNFNLKPK